MYLPIILAMVLYPVLAVLFVRFVWKRSSSKQFRWLAIAFAVLLPSWDAVLSAVVFYAACPFFPKAEVYERAETEGIYYEGFLRDTVYVGKSWYGREVNRIGLATNQDIKNGYQFMEFLVTKRHGLDDKVSALPHPTVYRCIEDRKDPKHEWITHEQCFLVEEIKSQYKVKSEYYKILLIGMSFVNIYDRKTGRLMAEYRSIAKSPYAGAPFYPFFTWLNWHGDMFQANQAASCPEKSQFLTFQYDVLRVKK
jgi:hypothetical protein